MVIGNLKDKVAVVTGSNSGIGKEIAQLFSANGAKVVITNEMDVKIAEETALEINKNTGNETFAVKLDISDESDIHTCIEKTLNHFGKIDILVNNAGIQIINPVDEFSTADWDKLTDIHIRGSFLMSRECIKYMKQQNKGGKIIFTGSVHSFLASPNKIAYITSKHAQLGMVRALAVECSKYNISTNLVAPGFVLTPLAQKQIPERAKLNNCSEEDIKKSMVQNTADGQFTTAEEVAQTVLFFASFEGTALTGQSLIVSHGWCMD